MPSLPLNVVQDAIRKAGHQWEARDTRVSLSAREIQPGNMFGLNIGEPERI